MFKKLLQTVKKEKTESSVSESIEQRLKEIPDVQGQNEIKLSNNKLVETEEVEDCLRKDFKLEINEYSSAFDNLDRFKVQGIDSVYYIPNFITQQDESNINDQIYDLPNKTWVTLPHSSRRLQKWGGNVTQKGLQDQQPLPSFLEALSQKLYLNQFSPKKTNHVLLNEYQKGIGIMPHTDGPLYFPWVNSISLGSSCIFKFFKDMQHYQEEKEEGRILLERRSMVIFTDQAYKEFMHSIDDLNSDIILLYIEEIQSENQLIQIKRANVLNFFQSELKKQLDLLTIEQALHDELILKLKDNSEYNYCLELNRDKRISLTIRNVPLPQEEEVIKS